MPRTLSSAQTFLMKVIIPAIWIIGFAAVTIATFLSPTFSRDLGRRASGANPQWMFLGLTIVGGGFLYKVCMGLKRVALDGDQLVVSNYRRTVRIPLQQIEDVTENRWLNIHPVTVHFRNETDFGWSIVFMPKVRVFGFWFSHPVVRELRNAAERASARGPVSPAG